MTYRCGDCGHIALYDYKDNLQSSESFATNKERAYFYLKRLKDISFESILEIGTPDDFYFLNRSFIPRQLAAGSPKF